MTCTSFFGAARFTTFLQEFCAQPITSELGVKLMRMMTEFPIVWPKVQRTIGRNMRCRTSTLLCWFCDHLGAECAEEDQSLQGFFSSKLRQAVAHFRNRAH